MGAAPQPHSSVFLEASDQKPHTEVGAEVKRARYRGKTEDPKISAKRWADAVKRQREECPGDEGVRSTREGPGVRGRKT